MTYKIPLRVCVIHFICLTFYYFLFRPLLLCLTVHFQKIKIYTASSFHINSSIVSFRCTWRPPPYKVRPSSRLRLRFCTLASTTNSFTGNTDLISSHHLTMSPPSLRPDLRTTFLTPKLGSLAPSATH